VQCCCVQCLSLRDVSSRCLSPLFRCFSSSRTDTDYHSWPASGQHSAAGCTSSETSHTTGLPPAASPFRLVDMHPVRNGAKQTRIFYICLTNHWIRYNSKAFPVHTP
jgi:hypothetical protein